MCIKGSDCKLTPYESQIILFCPIVYSENVCSHSKEDRKQYSVYIQTSIALLKYEASFKNSHENVYAFIF